MKKRLPQVALLIGFSRKYRRGILRGIARYVRAHGPWSCFTPEQGLYAGIPDWLKTWKGDGIVACIDSSRTAKALPRMNCPVIDVLHNAQFAGIPCFDTDAGIVAKFAAEYFLKAGFRHFAFCGLPGIPFSDRREAAFVDCLSAGRFEVRVFSAPQKKNLRLGEIAEQSGFATDSHLCRAFNPLQNDARCIPLVV